MRLVTFSKGQQWKQGLSDCEFSFLLISNHIRKSSVYLQITQIYLSSVCSPNHIIYLKHELLNLTSAHTLNGEGRNKKECNVLQTGSWDLCNYWGFGDVYSTQYKSLGVDRLQRGRALLKEGSEWPWSCFFSLSLSLSSNARKFLDHRAGMETLPLIKCCL